MGDASPPGTKEEPKFWLVQTAQSHVATEWA